MNRDSLDRFLSKIEIDENTGCWIWVAAKDGDGYGTIKFQGTQYRAHRLSYEHFVGPIPEGFVVRHNCPSGDNSSCVNPEHLLAGTHQDNMRDMVAARRHKGKGACPGERHGNAKLTDNDVEVIRLLHSTKQMKQTELCLAFGISSGMMSKIVNRKYWRHI